MFYASTVGGGAMTSVIVRKEEKSSLKENHAPAAQALRQRPVAVKKEPAADKKEAA